MVLKEIDFEKIKKDANEKTSKFKIIDDFAHQLKINKKFEVIKEDKTHKIVFPDKK